MRGEKRMLLDWGNGKLHMVAPGWRPGEGPWNACGSALPAPGAKPQTIYWAVVPRAVASEMCQRCLRKAAEGG